MDEEVVLDYYHTTIYPSEYEKTVEKGGYVKMPYLHSKGDSQPNLVYGVRKYKTKTLFIVKSSSPDYDGELVIKHAPITNGDTSVYLVIPLKTRPTVYEETAIDKIIQHVNTSSFEFHLGELIVYNETCKLSADNTVFMLSPMLVKSSFDAFLPMKEKEWNTEGKFRNVALVFQGHTVAKPRIAGEGGDGVEGFSAPLDSKTKGQYDIYDCEPIIQNDGKNKPTIEVMPVTSELAKNVGRMNVMNATIHFFIFVIMVILSGITTPVLYKTLFVDYIANLGIKADTQASSLKSFSYIGTVVLLFFSLGISINGMSAKDSIQTSIGAMMTIFIIISISVMTYYKQLDPITYSFGKPDADIFDSELMSAVWSRILLNDNYMKVLGVWGIVVLVSLLTYFFGRFDKNKKKNKTKKDLILSYGFIFGLLFSLYLVTRIYKVA